MDYEREINKYVANKDLNAAVLNECYFELDKIRKEGKELSSVEGFKCHYLICLILNDYFFHRNIDSFKNYRNKTDLYNDVDYLYSKITSCNPPFELKNETVVELDTFGRRQLSVREVLYGNDAGYPYQIFNSYNLTYNKILVGMKDFISYLEFIHLVESKDFGKARDLAEANIKTIQFIKKHYPGGKKVEIDSELMFWISSDLDMLTDGEAESGEPFETVFPKIPDEQFKLRVEPTVKVLCSYYETLEDGEYKDYIYYLIRILPITVDSKALIENVIQKTVFEKLVKISSMGFETEEKIDQGFEEADRITNNTAKADIYDTLEYKYPYINFDNLDDNTKKYVANGNYVYDIFKQFENKEHLDFSLPIIGWSKAVENEYRIKMIDPILSDDAVCDDLWYRYHIDANRLDTLGSSEVLLKAIKDLFNNVYKKKYENVNNGFFISIFSQIKNLHEYRNSAAHAGGIMYMNDAKVCQDLVLKSQKILEYMSKLPIKKDLK